MHKEQIKTGVFVNFEDAKTIEGGDLFFFRGEIIA